MPSQKNGDSMVRPMAEELPSNKAGTSIDQQDMYRMGKRQQFRRNFRFLPVFGFAATLMSTWEGVLINSSFTFPNGGRPAIIWTFLVSLFGFGAAILSMAEMASIAPTSGGQYHWVSEFAPRSAQKILSYVIGWFCVLGWQAGTAGQAFGSALQVQGLIVLNDDTYQPHPWHSTLLAIAVVVVGVFFNTVLARKLPIIENVILTFHIIGFFAVLITLWVTAPKASSSEVWGDFTNLAGWSSTGLAFCVGLTGSIASLIGPDAAVHISEETRDASRIVPQAMLGTLAFNGIAGFVMCITFAYCLGPLEAALEPKYGFAFIGTFYTATQSHAGTTILTCIITVLQVGSAMAGIATSSRQMFAFARDQGLPFGRWLSSTRWDLPMNAILVTSLIAALLSLINLGSSVAFNAILSIGVVSLLASYLVSITCVLIKRLRGEELLFRRWSLGAWGLPLNIIGLAYLSIVFVFAFFPIGTPVSANTMNWASAAFGGVAIVATVYYVFYARHRYVAPVSRLAKDA